MPYKNPEDQKRAARRHYEANKAAYLARARAHNKRQAEVLKALVRAEKSKPCTDCGRFYPYYVMQFDHVRGEKLFNIADRVCTGISVARMRAEIAKCEVVCANCHAERTYLRRIAEAED